MDRRGPADGGGPKAPASANKVGKCRKAYLIEDVADWDSVNLVSIDVGTAHKPRRLRFKDYQYCTEGEWHLAQLLSAHGVPFTPDVSFSLTLPDGKPRRFVPDFIFDRQAWLWGTSGRRVELVHGFEVKGNAHGNVFSERARQNVRLLWEQYGINVKLMSDARAARLFERWLRHPDRRVLPMVPLDIR